MLATLLVAVASIPQIVPPPAKIVAKPGAYFLPREILSISFDVLLAKESKLCSTWERAVEVRTKGRPANVTAVVDPKLGAEAYRLRVTTKGIRVEAGGKPGAFYALQTLRQLMPIQLDGPVRIPCVEIEDEPRFPWRGFMLDVSRHFFPKRDILRLLDILADHKINVFHWHLNDDGGWRLEIKSHPELTSIGAWRLPANGEYPIFEGLRFPGPKAGQKLYGGFYTQADVREIVRYATERHIDVVPEIDMPGHNFAATSAVPWLVCDGGGKADYFPESTLEHPHMFCAGKESTYQFTQDVLSEVATLFPSQYIHVGGDEVEQFAWAKCPHCQGVVQVKGLKNLSELQDYFMRRVEDQIDKLGRKMVAWDDVMDGGLPTKTTIMSWRGTQGGIKAAQSGRNVIMTPGDATYLSRPPESLSMGDVAAFEPIPDVLEKYADKVLGIQACVWTERIFNFDRVEELILPRLAATASVAWSPRGVRPKIEGLGPYLDRLTAKKLNFSVPSPECDLNVVPFGGTATFQWARLKGAKLTYTTDGSEPTAKSKAYATPLIFKKPTTIKAVLFLADGRRSETISVAFADLRPTTSAALKPGVAWRLFAGDFAKVPDFAALTPRATGIGEGLKVYGDLQDSFALEFSGYIKIPTDGDYTFSLASDDGSVLWLGGAKLVDNDGYHALVERFSRVRLKAGVYTLKVGFTEGTEEAILRAYVKGPGIPKQQIPASWLFHD